MSLYTLQTENDVARLTFTHSPVNVLRAAMLDEMARDLHPLTDLRLLLVQGAGRVFSAGMDVREHLPADVGRMLAAVRRFFHAVWRLQCPVLAAVHGSTLGGAAELLLLCDVVVAADDAVIGFPEVRVGSYPPLAVLRLPQLLSWPRAAELILEGRTVNAAEALAWGLVNEVVPRADLDAAVERRAARLLACSAAVQGHAKRAMRVGDDLFERLERVERIYLDELMKSGDAVEGILAFLDKRPPQWRHR